MAVDQETPTSSGIAPLITGIVDDAVVLIRQQLSLFQSEIKNDMRRTRDAAIPLAFGAAAAFVAGIIACLTLVHLLVWLWPDLPLFAAYGIVGLGIGLIAAALILMGKSRFDKFNPLPDESLEGLKENLQWKTKT